MLSLLSGQRLVQQQDLFPHIIKPFNLDPMLHIYDEEHQNLFEFTRTVKRGKSVEVINLFGFYSSSLALTQY